MKKKILVGVIAVYVGVVLLYWVKGMFGIDISGSLSLHGIFPFSYLSGTVISPDSGEIVFQDSFDSKRVWFKKWGVLWSEEEGRVTRYNYPGKGRDGTGCEVIASQSRESWSLPYRKLIRVKKGDRFSFEAYGSWLTGERATANIDIAILDGQQQVLDYNFRRFPFPAVGEYVQVAETVQVPDGVEYLEFRITGAGEGGYCFDDVVLRKL